ncbi:HPr family phosphocarrier protein [Halostella litorea]|uniref:HPr family phosphocarrier protein n=1 Tax=Halostella litorea TaxID=2528831 RepID=UPI001092AC35|nr:HPr family phosphocarrier protein [Halostella litorea]
MSAERTVTVVPEDGLHARPAAAFVEAANEHDAEVEVGAADGDLVAAGSMIAVTSLGVASGDDVRLVAEGDDAEAALDALTDILTTPEDELDA